MMKLSGKIAFAGIICCLAVACMLLTVIPTMEIGLPALAGCLLVLPTIELGVRYGFLCYGATAFLTFLLAPSLEAKLLFVLFLGYYPVLKAVIERLPSAVLQWVVKLALFNLMISAAYWLLIHVFTAVPTDDFVLFGVYLPAVLLLMGNVVFIVYDIALTRVISAYLRFGQSRLRKMFRF
ncbi:MAG: hypothetical protein J6L00_00420 [Clostridia bacterium]|nr:hypothetical protein [Clostridia bacterium]